MENIKFYTEEYVHQEIKILCINKGICTNGTIFYTFEFNGGFIYTVDSSEKNFSYSEILEIYKSYLKRAKNVDSIVKNIKEIEVSFDNWENVGNKVIGSYKNDAFEVEVKNYLITFYLEVSEKGIETGGYNSPNEYDKINSKVWIDDIVIINDDSEKLFLTDEDYKKVLKELIKNIIF